MLVREAVEVHYFGSLVEQVELEMVWLGSKAGVSQAYGDSEFIHYEHGVIQGGDKTGFRPISRKLSV